MSPDPASARSCIFLATHPLKRERRDRCPDCKGGSCTSSPAEHEKYTCGARGSDVLAKLRRACDAGDAAALRIVLLENPGLPVGELEDEGELPSPLLNLAAENGFATVVEALVDVGGVRPPSRHCRRALRLRRLWRPPAGASAAGADECQERCMRAVPPRNSTLRAG